MPHQEEDTPLEEEKYNELEHSDLEQEAFMTIDTFATRTVQTQTAHAHQEERNRQTMEEAQIEEDQETPDEGLLQLLPNKFSGKSLTLYEINAK